MIEGREKKQEGGAELGKKGGAARLPANNLNRKLKKENMRGQEKKEGAHINQARRETQGPLWHQGERAKMSIKRTEKNILRISNVQFAVEERDQQGTTHAQGGKGLRQRDANNKRQLGAKTKR